MAVVGPTGQQKTHLDENKPQDPCNAMAVIGIRKHGNHYRGNGWVLNPA